MSEPVDHAQTKRHNLHDWLDLHALDQQTCRDILDAIGREVAEMPVQRKDLGERYHALDPEGCWSVAIAAMRDFLPDHCGIIDETFLGSEKIAIVRSRKSRRALTIDHGPAKYPTILYHFHGDPSDPLVVAHEFGHALQIRASGGMFLPPVMREVCAFLAEGALLSHCLDHGLIQYAALLERWQDDNRRYFGKIATKLNADLANPDAVYDYSWNYPVARLIAHRISNNFSRDSIWGVFQGGCSVRTALDRLAI